MNKPLASDPRLPSIIAAIEGGRSMRAAAKDFGVSEDALNRYFARYGDKAPKIPDRSASTTDGSDVGTTIWHRLSAQMSAIEEMAKQPGLSQRAYLDLVTQMRLLATEMAKHQPPQEQDISRLIVESEEWIRLRESVVEWLIKEDPTRGLEHRFRQLIDREVGPEAGDTAALRQDTE
jgi:hypothetical protein